MKKYKEVRFYGLKYFLLIIVVLAIWEIASLSGGLPAYMLPAPHSILELFINKLSTGELIINIVVSIRRVFLGFIIAAVTAIIFGVFISVSKDFDVITSLILQILKPIPPIAWIPIAIIWLGIGEGSKIFIIFIGSFFPILTNVIDGIVNIDKRFLRFLKHLKFQGESLLRM